MTDLAVVTTKNAAASLDPSRSAKIIDPALAYPGAGPDWVRFLFDLDFSPGWPGGPRIGRPAQGAPLNGQVVPDLSGHGDGYVEVNSGGSIAYAAGGFDLTNAERTQGSSLVGSSVIAPASVSADLYAAQEYLIWSFFKLPPINAPAWSGKGSFESIMGTGLGSTAGIGTLALSSPGSVLNFYRQVALSTNAQLAMTGLTAPDSFALVGISRTAAEQKIYYRSESLPDAIVATMSEGALNTADFSASKIQWGYRDGYTNYNGAVNPLRAGLRLFRGGVANLARGSVDPFDFLDDVEWVWAQKRIAANKVANGGTQTIWK